FFVGVESACATPVVLQVINSPGSVGAGVLFLVTVTAFVTGAGVGTGRRINPELQTFAVNIIGQRLHVRKFLVGLDVTLRVAAGFPGVVNVDVSVSGCPHAVTGHGVGNTAHRRVINPAGELIPTVPTHRRRARQTV